MGRIELDENYVIPMMKKHVKMIKLGKKSSTLRSLKEVFGKRIYYLPDGTKILIKERILVNVKEDKILNFDGGMGYYGVEDEVAKWEGYDKWEDVVRVLKSMRHKLPKRMWLYRFEVINNFMNKIE